MPSNEDIILTLIKQNTINDNTLLCSSLTSLSEKLGNDLTMWTNRFTHNEYTKNKLLNDFNSMKQQQLQQNNYSSNNNDTPNTPNQ